MFQGLGPDIFESHVKSITVGKNSSKCAIKICAFYCSRIIPQLRNAHTPEKEIMI